MSKALYTIAGFSTHPTKGRKFRASNREVYPEILVKEGHLDVEMYDLPEPMSRVDAKAYIEATFGTVAPAETPAEVVTSEILDEALIAAMAAHAEAEEAAFQAEPEEAEEEAEEETEVVSEEETEVVSEGTDEAVDFQEEEMVD